jgi:hypothetical protein
MDLLGRLDQQESLAQLVAPEQRGRLASPARKAFKVLPVSPVRLVPRVPLAHKVSRAFKALSVRLAPRA